MLDKLVNGLIKLVVALIAVNLVCCLLLQLLSQHPFQGLVVILITSGVAYFVREYRASHGGHARRAGGQERTPMMPRGWDE
jgi:hypothetical protein